MHHKYSIFYYILLDFDQTSEHESVSEAFVEASGMPKKYEIFMKGLWYLDRHDFSVGLLHACHQSSPLTLLQRALEYVSHPSLIPDFADDIITVLVRRASDNDYSIALSYFYAVQPILKTSAALELLFDAMAQTNVSEALLYSRTHPPQTRELLFRKLVATVLDYQGEDHADRAAELAFLPFDTAEEGWFEEYLLRGDGKAHKKAKDTLLIRKIACDQFSDVSKIRQGGHWSGILEGIKGGISGHAD